ncbi:MAG: methanogenesis marker 12 protein [Methanobrevibacter sp.]|jgi:putative methanogenesis marker protein 12|nr:methanogenesis marker 12 protein [Candidatus Methanovirga basalitermitum]
MAFVGMDHGTTGISFGIIHDENIEDVEFFKIDREDSKIGKVSAIEELSKRVDLKSIKLLAMTYGMGDGINSILPIKKVKNRGILSINGAGKVTGGGTSVYLEIEKSNIPTVLIPGLHKNLSSLDKRFNAAYSHQASAEKLSISYNAYLTTKWENMIVADISSNSVNILIENGKIRGAIDACLGAMGIVHGPIDLEMIRNIDEGKSTANESFSNAGAVKIADVDGNVAFLKDKVLEKYKKNDPKGVLAIETLAMTVAMEIYSLTGISNKKIDGICLTGSLGSMKTPLNFENLLNKFLKNRFNIKILPISSGATGSTQIALDVYNGRKDVLGIDVKI